jgi:AraC-like DNA-binding protein
VFEVWDVGLPRVPPRTRLYPLKPVGIGTAFVESVTGYMMRLAEAHAVPVGALINHGLALQRSAAGLEGPYPSRFLSYRANGSGKSTASCVHALERATCQNNLSLLTFLPLKPGFCTTHLFRERRAWCPGCYNDWRRTACTVYEPLLWSVRLFSVCSHHRMVLAEACPHCRRPMRPLGTLARPGHCDHCQRWLGAGGGLGMRRGATPHPDPNDLAIWLSDAVEQLVSLMPGLLDGSLRRTFRRNLRSCIDHLFGGHMASLARFAGEGTYSLPYWLEGFFAPRLDQVLQLAERLRIPIGEFLLGPSAKGGVDWDSIKPATERYTRPETKYRAAKETRRALRQALRERPAPSLSEVARRLNYRTPARLRKVSRRLCKRITKNYEKSFAPQPYHRGPRPRLCELGRIKKALLRSLTQKEPESVPRIAARLGYASSAPILEKFPLLCRLIYRKTVSCKKARIRSMRKRFKRALQRDDPPTLRQLANRLGFKDKKVLTRYFPALHAELLARRRFLKNKSVADLRARLRHWIKVDPPPSLAQIGRDLALPPSTVARKCPDECKVIRLRRSGRGNS